MDKVSLQGNTRYFRIAGISGLDPVEVFVWENNNAGRLTVCCHDRAWTCAWNSMDDTIENMLYRSTPERIAQCLLKGSMGVIDEAEWLTHDTRALIEYATLIRDAVHAGALSVFREAA